MSEQEELIAILKTPSELIRFLPIRVVLRKGDDGTLKGLCEDSFSMSVSSNNVRIWWSGKAYSMIGNFNINGIDDAKGQAKDGDLIIDPLADDSPITIDWGRWLAASTKYSKRNATFTIKGVA